MLHKLKSILSSSQFVMICITLIILGFLTTYFTLFSTKQDQQSQIISQIQATQVSIIDLRQKVSDLTSTNQKLTILVCTLQEQLKTLGATPVQTLVECDNVFNSQ